MACDPVKGPWTTAEIKKLRELARPQTLFLKEISIELGRPVVNVRWKAKQLGIISKPKDRMGKWNTKHAHLREAALKYFLTHTTAETREHFGLTPSECKSLFTIAYRMPEYKHLRKETRRHDAWSLDETLFFLRHAGLRERTWITARLSRGGMHAAKEHLRRLGGIWSKQMHGLPAKIVHERLGLRMRGLRTNAGPINKTHSYRYLIVPWVELEERIHLSPIHDEVAGAIRALAQFQKWIYGTKDTKITVKEIIKAIGGLNDEPSGKKANGSRGLRTVQHKKRHQNAGGADGKSNVTKLHGGNRERSL